MKLLISSVCIVASFFLWFYFSERKNEVLLQEITAKESFINIKINKNKLSIEKNTENIFVLINGEKLTWDIELENVCY